MADRPARARDPRLMPRGWRLVKWKHVDAAFTGEGARRSGSRWTSPGQRCVFAAESLSLATLEILAHLDRTESLQDYCVFTVDFPLRAVETLNVRALPQTWRQTPVLREVQTIGDTWLSEQRSLLLKVPSV